MPRPRKRARTFSTKDGEAPVSEASFTIDSSSVILRDPMTSRTVLPATLFMYGESLAGQARALSAFSKPGKHRNALQSRDDRTRFAQPRFGFQAVLK